MMEGSTSKMEIPRKKTWREYCFVPRCSSTSISTPGKVFVSVPLNPVLRRKWMIAARRDLKTMPSPSSHLRCCEDHFNLEEDADNYMRWRIMGGLLLIKKGVVPHIFKCQDRPSNSPFSESSVLKNRLIIELLQSRSTSTEMTEEPMEDHLSEGEVAISRQHEDPGLENYHPHDVPSDKCVQFRSPHRSKMIQTYNRDMLTSATSPIKVSVCSTATSPVKSLDCMYQSDESERSTADDIHDDIYSCDESQSDEFFDSEEDLKKMKEDSYKCIAFFIEKDPKLYLGIPPKTFVILSILSRKVETTSKNIMLCLKKIKLNDSLKVLGNEFGMHYSRVSRVLREVVPMISKYMSDLIFWPNEESRLRTLPNAFIAYFSTVSCIIDCLEISIEKPSNVVHQAMSWSQYKKANTIKYLISCSPNGFINFISEGYLGRASDEAISLDCGFLDRLRPGSVVMADRGFKNLEAALAKRQCKLVRPPSVSSGEQLSKGDVRFTKRVASLRIHVERVIGRIRDFAILKPCTVMDHNLVTLSDHMVVIACGMTNLNNQIVKV